MRPFGVCGDEPGLLPDDHSMNSIAVVFEQPERLRIQRLDLSEAGSEDVVVDVHHSGISTGTEKLLWTGRMPMFPVVEDRPPDGT